MAIAQVRHFRSLPEVRRIIKKLSNYVVADSNSYKNIKRTLEGSLRITASVDDAPRRGRLSVRDGKKTVTEPEVPKVPFDAKMSGKVTKLSNLLSTQQERKEVAEHIKNLLIHTYDSKNDNTANRMLELTENLITTYEDAVKESTKLLNSVAKTVIPQHFIDLSEGIYTKLQQRFEDKYEDVDGQLSIATNDYKSIPSKFYISYIIFKNLQGQSATQDYVVVTTRVEPIDPAKIKMVGIKHFVRALATYKPPTWIAEHPLGVEIPIDTTSPAHDGQLKTAAEFILLHMRADDMIAAVDPVAIPLRKNEIVVSDKNIDVVLPKEEKGLIRFILKPSVKSVEQVEEVIKTTLPEIKSLIGKSHPRYANIVRSVNPKVQIAFSTKDKEGKPIKPLRYYFDIVFARPDEISMELPNDRIKKAMDALDIHDPAIMQKIARGLKNMLGIVTTKEDSDKRKAQENKPVTNTSDEKPKLTPGQIAKDKQDKVVNEKRAEQERRAEERRLKEEAKEGKTKVTEVEEEEKPVEEEKPKPAGKIRRSLPVVDEDEEDAPAPVPKKEQAKPANKLSILPNKKTGKALPVEEDEEDAPAPKKPSATKPAPVKPSSKPAAKPAAVSQGKDQRKPFSFKRK